MANQMRGELRGARRKRGHGRLVGLRGGGGRQRARAVRGDLLVVCTLNDHQLANHISRTQNSGEALSNSADGSAEQQSTESSSSQV